MSRNANTGKNAVLQIEAEAASFGALRTTDSTGRPRFEVTCGNCGKQHDMFHSAINHVEQVLAHFRKKGWIFNYHTSPYCSTQCIRSAKQVKKDERKEEEMKHLETVIASKPIEPSAKISRRVITSLNEHFDTDKRLYESGWSDERIAKEADASIEFVIKTRKDAYAELAENPEATKFRADLKILEEQVYKMVEKIDEMKNRLDRITGIHHKAQG